MGSTPSSPTLQLPVQQQTTESHDLALIKSQMVEMQKAITALLNTSSVAATEASINALKQTLAVAQQQTATALQQASSAQQQASSANQQASSARQILEAMQQKNYVESALFNQLVNQVGSNIQSQDDLFNELASLKNYVSRLPTSGNTPDVVDQFSQIKNSIDLLSNKIDKEFALYGWSGLGQTEWRPERPRFSSDITPAPDRWLAGNYNFVSDNQLRLTVGKIYRLTFTALCWSSGIGSYVSWVRARDGVELLGPDSPRSFTKHVDGVAMEFAMTVCECVYSPSNLDNSAVTVKFTAPPELPGTVNGFFVNRAYMIVQEL